MSYLSHIVSGIGIMFIMSLGLNLSLGYTGLINFGHVALFGIGSYTSAILTQAGIPFFLAFLLAGLVAAGFGYILVLATDKLKGDYMALATLAFNYVIFSLMLNLTGLTRGARGIPGIPQPVLFGVEISRGWPFAILVIVIAVLSLLTTWLIIRSPFGRLLQATRDDERGLRVLGKNTFALKAKAMMISAFIAGMAGSLMAHFLTYISPYGYHLQQIIVVISVVIIGGLASLRGTVVATVVLYLIPDILRFLPFPPGIVGPLQRLLFAALLLVIMLWRPRGMFGKVDLEDA